MALKEDWSSKEAHGNHRIINSTEVSFSYHVRTRTHQDSLLQNCEEKLEVQARLCKLLTKTLEKLFLFLRSKD
jgi:hypothetical protein